MATKINVKLAVLSLAVMGAAYSCKPKQVENAPAPRLVIDTTQVEQLPPPPEPEARRAVEEAAPVLPPAPEPEPEPVAPPAPVYVKTKAVASVKLFNQSYLGKEGRFWGVAAEKTYTIEQLTVKAVADQAKADIAYVTRANGNKLVSPASQDAYEVYSSVATPKQWEDDKISINKWTKRKSTKFIQTSISAKEIAEVKDGNFDVLIKKAISASGEPNSDSIIIGDLNTAILFKNEDGKYGLIVVKQATGGVVGDNKKATSGSVEFAAYYQVD